MAIGDDSKESQESHAEYWAEHTDGGHNYGFTVYWELVKRPPNEWINKQIMQLRQRIYYAEQDIEYWTNMMSQPMEENVKPL